MILMMCLCGLFREHRLVCNSSSISGLFQNATLTRLIYRYFITATIRRSKRRAGSYRWGASDHASRPVEPARLNSVWRAWPSVIIVNRCPDFFDEPITSIQVVRNRPKPVPGSGTTLRGNICFRYRQILSSNLDPLA